MDADGSQGFLPALIKKYLANANSDLELLASSVQRGDAARFGKIAHRLKSSSANLGAMNLASICKELEVAGRAEQIEGADTLLTAIKSEYERVDQVLGQEIRNTV